MTDAATDQDRARPGRRRLALETFGVAGIAWVWAAIVFRVWDMPMHLPWDTRSDATLISSMVKTIQERGWYLNQPRLGAPYGQQFYDFPHGGESFQLFAMKLLVKVTGDWGLAINLYFLFGFGVVAAVTFLVLRHLRFGPVIAGVASLLYAFLPYHFTHGEMHLWRSTYYSAPLAALLIIWVGSWRTRFLIDPERTGRGSIRGNLHVSRVVGALAIAVIIAGTETMTTGFTMVLLATSSLIWAIRWREPQRLLIGAAVVLIMAATFAVLSYPTLNFYRAYGTNEQAARRLLTESEWYGVKISRLVTPQGGHRFGPLSDLGAKAQEKSVIPSEGGQALGILGTAGFLGILYGVVAGRRRRSRSPDLAPASRRQVLAETGQQITLLALLFGVPGGLAVVVAMAGFSQIRVWDRIMLFIAFFSMVLVATWSERFARWLRGRIGPSRPVLGAIAVGVLDFGLWDGIPPPRPSYAAIEARHANDRTFVAEIERRMPADSAIFQLPILPFPEVLPPGRMLDYDPLRAYLADNGDLRWSYGSIKGRPDADWQIYLRDHVGPVAGLPALLGMGFTGIWLDTAGYTDGGREVSLLRAATREDPLVSPDGRFLFFDLRPVKKRLGLTDAQLRAEAKRVLHVEPPEPPR